MGPTPYSLLLTPYSLLHTPHGYSLLPTPYSLLPTPYSLLPTPYSLLLTTWALLPTPYSLLPYSLLPTPYSFLSLFPITPFILLCALSSKLVSPSVFLCPFYDARAAFHLLSSIPFRLLLLSFPSSPPSTLRLPSILPPHPHLLRPPHPYLLRP